MSTRAKVQAMADRVESALHEKGALSLTELSLELGDVSANELALAVGWLANRGGVRVERKARSAVWVSLVSQGALTDLDHLADLGLAIRRVLHRGGTMTMASLVREIPGTSSSLVALAVGWLARGEVISLFDRSEGLKVGLTKDEPDVCIRSAL